MGLFRVICVFSSHIAIKMESAWRLMKAIISFQLMMTMVCFIFGIVGFSYAGKEDTIHTGPLGNLKN